MNEATQFDQEKESRRTFLGTFRNSDYAVRSDGPLHLNEFNLYVWPLAWQNADLFVRGTEKGIRIILDTNESVSIETITRVGTVFPVMSEVGDNVFLLKELSVSVNESFWRAVNGQAHEIKTVIDDIVKKLYDYAVDL